MSDRQLILEPAAARYVGCTRYYFRKLVREGVLPPSWKGTRLWDLRKLEAAVRDDGDAVREKAA